MSGNRKALADVEADGSKYGIRRAVAAHRRVIDQGMRHLLNVT